MITVTLFRVDGSVTRVTAEGHSGLAESGSDVLCAAVSALVQTAYLAISDISHGKAEFKRDDERAYFEFTVPKLADRHDADVILRAMCLGLQDLSSGFPQNLKLEDA